MKFLIHFQTSTLQCWSLGMDKLFHPTLYKGCNYLSMLALKLIYGQEEHRSKHSDYTIERQPIPHPKCELQKLQCFQHDYLIENQACYGWTILYMHNENDDTLMEIVMIGHATVSESCIFLCRTHFDIKYKHKSVFASKWFTHGKVDCCE